MTSICPIGQQCCFDKYGHHTGCYDPNKCQDCIDGKVVDQDTNQLTLNCKKCSYVLNPPILNICTIDKPDCCYGICYEEGKDCKTCNHTTKQLDGCPTGQECCQNNSLTGIGCWDPNSSANKCKKCQNGFLVDKCENPTSFCCPDTGNCIDDTCQNCDGTPKCTGNTYCCKCPDKLCCDKCEDCNGAITLSPQDIANCLKCDGSNKVSKCNADQECCGGTCIKKDSNCAYCDNGTIQDSCKNAIGVNNPNYTNYGKDTCCGGTCWDPLGGNKIDRCQKCVNDQLVPKCDPGYECCDNGSCRDTNDLCTTCATNGGIVPIGIGPDSICCEKSITNKKNCCNDKLLKSNEGCCNDSPFDTNESICCNNQVLNKNIYSCCLDDSGYGAPYNIYNQKCCNKKVIDISSYKECCDLMDPPVEYSPKCKKCTASGLVNTYDEGCFDCNDYSGTLTPKCTGVFKCCSNWNPSGTGNPSAIGSCYDASKKCDKCNDGTVIKQCTGTDEECCGGNCWKPNQNKCKVCVDGQLEDKCPTVAGVGKDTFGKKIILRVKDGKNNCCDATGECWGGCDMCESYNPPFLGGVTPNFLCKNNTDGKTSCCDDSPTKDAECYNPECYYCFRGVKLRNECTAGCCDNKCCKTTCCNNVCCPDGQTCCNNECKPKNYIQCGSECVDPKQCCNGVLMSSDEICCGGQPHPTSTCSECCNGECVDSSHQCCHDLDPPYIIPIDTFCCKGECVRPCCNGTCCPQNTPECCAGPAGSGGGCYNEQDCKTCTNGTVTSTLAAGQMCCGGIPFSPKDCESCVSGVKIPYVPSKPECYCNNGSEVCNCNNTPTRWVLSEGATGLVYESGGMSQQGNTDNYDYSGISPGFTSRYCYTGHMSIYVTCSDGSRVLTRAFASYCNTTQLLPQSVGNPCCPQ